MKIAILGTVHKTIKKDAFGGTESFTYWLTEGLIKKGHQVTLFAHPESKTNARLMSPPFIDDKKTSLDCFWPNQLNNLYYAFEVIKRESDFDVVHNNLFETYPAMPFAKYLDRGGTIFLSTIHNDYFSNPETAKIFGLYRDEHYFFVSKFAYRQAKNQGYPNIGYVYNGIDLGSHPANLNNPSDYFLWLGRINYKKGLDDAIQATKKANVKLVIAGIIDSPKNKVFFDEKIKPQIDDKMIKYIGPVEKEGKIKLYQNAKALLFPAKWDEPFGLVAGEAMASGTPVIGYKRGALSELIVDSKTGFLVKENSIKGLVNSIKKIDNIKRRDCRERIEQNFSLENTIDSYEKIYTKFLKKI